MSSFFGQLSVCKAVSGTGGEKKKPINFTPSMFVERAVFYGL